MTTSSASSQSHRSHEPKQDRSRATRDRILRSTISCLAESGWHGATMTLIAQEAGVSRGALQHHFPTREDLFLTAIDYMFEEREQAGLQAPRSQATPGDDFDHIVEKVLEYYASDVFKAALQIWCVAASELALKERIRPLEDKFARGIYTETVRILNADVSDERTRRFIQTTLDLARGLGLADLLSDDSDRRKKIAQFWAAEMRTIKRLDPEEQG
ncbi:MULTISPECIES: TetR/AcrR family transcriptional regulator [Auritidibacter]|uniref:TetR/AcrR family transcriptional regulator n=1 Tax=Auritidibacter TaxID=1160973 RepID=UPI000D73C3C6|nr:MULTISPECIES: TetR/AcrR family transcriptional regulator [Auritidibacter]AXR73412.1 TetR/AcrR family transcriptional regulator [Auritidibacter sp. NML130574]NIH70794.1 AcrR family transcriptional regulator [Auritidibacter ignavus]PXA80313.1 TetR family transcriptional regulator [Auritidibacter sp. NML120636]RMX22344.1 TetR/AcrR family transcriptional regulator [Auritidibacter ignavus]WGH81988.1 TetR/AcrR family transcriptional regulator [Auritidibacter ignavus]